MNNTLTSLAFSMYSNKGVSALLLGSGISKSSGIPSAWDIVINLIKKLAISDGVSGTLENPAEWYREKYKQEPDYSVLLGTALETPTERVNVMKEYFEASEADRETHLKEPTTAHQNIAELAKRGYIKVIITTNFDRLMEKALEDVGIIPQIVSNADTIEGATPLIHSNTVTIVKIHGDYLDCRFLNTKEELEAYPEKLQKYLLRIINEFGLITCGWSGTWDIALIRALKQAENYRYNNFFTYVGNCEQQLIDLAHIRKGQTLRINGADDFFFELKERIEALEKFDKSHPLSKEITIARLKKYVSKPEHLISYYDLIENETERIYNQLYSNADLKITINPETFQDIISHQFHTIEDLLSICIVAVRWVKEEHHDGIVNLLEHFGKFPRLKQYTPGTENIYGFACTLLYYATGISCIIYNQYELLNKILNIERIENFHSKAENLLAVIHPLCLIQIGKISTVLKTRNDLFINNKVYDLLKPIFIKTVGSEIKYETGFNILEYLMSLQYILLCGNRWIPWGRFHYYKLYMDEKINSLNEFLAEADTCKNEWLPLKEGLFDGKYETFKELRVKAETFLNRINIH